MVTSLMQIKIFHGALTNLLPLDCCGALFLSWSFSVLTTCLLPTTVFRRFSLSQTHTHPLSPLIWTDYFMLCNISVS